MYVTDELILENCRIGRGAYRNFAGEKGPYNAQGKRTCVLILDADLGAKLKEQGWGPIKFREPRNEDDDPVALFTVECRFDRKPPVIKLHTKNGTTILDETNVAILDTADIERCDLVLSPYNWDVNGSTGTKGFIKEMHVTLHETNYFGGRYDE